MKSKKAFLNAISILLIAGFCISLPSMAFAATKSKNAYAKSLKISAGSLNRAFNKKVKAYTVLVAGETESTKITVVRADKKASMQVKNGIGKWSKYAKKNLSVTVKPGLGESVVAQFRIKSQKGNTNTYIITVFRAAPGGYDPGAEVPSGSKKTYVLVVENGTGSGSYEAGTKVRITPVIPANKEFDKWVITGNGTIDNPLWYSADFTMPESDAKVTATFVDKTYSFRVISGVIDAVNGNFSAKEVGSDSGDFIPGTVIRVTAVPPAGKMFYAWMHDGSYSQTINFVMPSYNTGITPMFKDIPAP